MTYNLMRANVVSLMNKGAPYSNRTYASQRTYVAKELCEIHRLYTNEIHEDEQNKEN